jgi:sigma-B regulation protein RsbU (phosphoserine phosphatase)
MMTGTPDSPKRQKIEKVDLSRLRHELRTPINHILGYSEMLLEESQLPPTVLGDLRRIHAGGRELQALIARYFDEQGFFQERNLHNLYHELRTPVNHIIGYSDLLIEQAEELGTQSTVPDLQKIRDAASNWLALMEAYLIEPVVNNATGDSAAGVEPGLALNLGFAFKIPEPKSSKGVFKDEGAILIVDDDESSREMLARRLRRSGYTVSAVSSGLHALSLARNQRFDLVMLDMIMPGLDGFQLLTKFKAEAGLREIPIIMLSALDEENGIARCIEMGAEDYLAKPFNSVFLRARIGACLEKKRLRDKERATYEALVKSERHLARELAEAAAYVRSLLPGPLTGRIEAEWCFHPSDQLGGDAFGYHWIDPDHLAIYLLDVCGHGVGAALLSVSALNTIRAESLAALDFREPAQVLAGLNRIFRMEHQNNLFFSIWYGVYSLSRREVRFASGGHPAAILLRPEPDGRCTPQSLRTEAPPVGCFDQIQYTVGTAPAPAGTKLLVFSDGVFEIYQGKERTGTWQEFVTEFEQESIQKLRPAERLKRALELRQAPALEDDFSFLELRFS